MSGNGNFRYVAAVIIGLVVDLSIALVLRSQFQLSLEISAVLGFLVAIGCNYLLFEFWVFKTPGASFSLERMAKTYGSALGALVLRVAIIYVSGFWIADGMLPDLLRLAVAIAASFVLNFALLKLVFRPK
ncbi:MAG: GtrA family protein [Parasphingorhabdus sp.]|uniref:GtrA family protein n=1 Tax=Parasphingorhabdus sp. TaxID=2709688 RepID=UPI003298F537